MMLPSAEASGAEARTAPGSGRRVPYTDLDAAKALAARGPTVLFFFADWCPTCQAAMRDIDENGSRLADITLVVVDYDRERDLARRYQVTYQHTFVQIDAAGARLAAWNGGGVEAILARVERAAAD
jgi:thiol-disulfide isomerase/thioredoxin